MNEILILDTHKMLPHLVGAKASGLATLQKDGLDIPTFFCLTPQAMSYAFAERWPRISEILSKLQSGAYTEGQATDSIGKLLSDLTMPVDLVRQITEAATAHMPGTEFFAVRSSGLAEDGEDHSFAGQYQSFLEVALDDVPAAVLECWRSALSLQILKYQNVQAKRASSLDPADFLIGVIVQKMVPAEISGVLFSVNPLGLLNESVISCGFGVGAGTLSDERPLTNYYYNLSDELWFCQAQRPSSEGSSPEGSSLEDSFTGGTLVGDVSAQDASPSLSGEQIKMLVKLGQDQEAKCGFAVDIEWALWDASLKILQCRPITTLNHAQDPVVLDNSNIVESYPGISSPLTRSFVKQVYYGVFSSLATRCLPTRKIVAGYDAMLQEMVASCNGRLYYQISNWYFILRFFPLQKKVIPIWQQMMGVENKQNGNSGIDRSTEQKAKASPSEKTLAPPWQRLVTWIKIAANVLTVQSKMHKLNEKFKSIEAEFVSRFNPESSNRQLLELYDLLAERLFKHWDLTLLNDMYTFLFTALVQRQVKKQDAQSRQSETAELIGSVADIESMKPVQSLLVLAKRALDDEQVQNVLAGMQSDADVWEFLQQNADYGTPESSNGTRSDLDSDASGSGASCDSFNLFGGGGDRNNLSDLANMLSEHIKCYGDRGLEELKLESRTWREYPLGLVKQVLNYTQDLEYRQNAYTALLTPKDDNSAAALQTKSPFLRFALKRAKGGIYNREISRLNRSRIFGMVRHIMLHIGANMQSAGVLADKRDIFLLELREIEEYVYDGIKSTGFVGDDINSVDYSSSNPTPTPTLNPTPTPTPTPTNKFKALVAERNKQQLSYAKFPAYSHLVFADKPFDRSGELSNLSTPAIDGLLQGTACSKGVAEAEVLLVDDLNCLGEVSGKILVTRMTDPGWVFLLAGAAGAVSEKGSLLSHTAIIARELKVPMVVGIDHITEILSNGDIVRLDGDTGKVEVLQRAQE